MELVDVDGGAVEVGEERVVPPIGPQSLLCFAGEAGASNHETAGDLMCAFAGGVRAISDLGLAVGGVVDLDPGGLGDRCDGVSNVFRAQRTAIV